MSPVPFGRFHFYQRTSAVLKSIVVSSVPVNWAEMNFTDLSLNTSTHAHKQTSLNLVFLQASRLKQFLTVACQTEQIHIQNKVERINFQYKVWPNGPDFLRSGHQRKEINPITQFIVAFLHLITPNSHFYRR